ncbi:hypothetical protein [Paenibacillus sp. NFR01]|uniref:hypothetical protein n=1 Tax=Paenibacillus sp. NFR01 TaxID=1566279 RepID=UPI0008CF9683|nr:hypothetical protein [Paenibacillus sp. NFR01]SET62162.1 hypothetical protein SAMN03159358_2210 [Paenibacillus sp. NFR01]
METAPIYLNRVDVRHVTITELNSILLSLNESNELNFKLIFITNSSFIQGDMVDPYVEVDDNELSFFHSVIEKTMDFRRDTLIEVEHENATMRPINDAAFIHLKNVTIKPLSGINTHKLDEMILFTDQISGLTFGEPFS